MKCHQVKTHNSQKCTHFFVKPQFQPWGLLLGVTNFHEPQPIFMQHDSKIGLLRSRSLMDWRQSLFKFLDTDLNFS